MSSDGSACPLSPKREHTDHKGLAWLAGAFVICPCHLPLTLGFAVTVLSGTAVGAMLSGHRYVAGAVITATWVAATWRGIRYLSSPR